LTTLIGLLLFFTFFFLSVIHFYWGLGGKWGANAAIPIKANNEKVINPKLFECFVVAFGLLGFGLFILVKTQILSFYLPNWLMKYGLLIISTIFILRAIGEFKYVGFFKKNKSTQFGQLDTKYYSPLCLAIGLLVMALALMR
jgi:NADH:ubiquinone oxidoreductase subunit 6 (subunit J)